MSEKKARYLRPSVSDQGKRAFFIILFIVLLTSIPPVKAFFSWLDFKATDIFFVLKPHFIKAEIEHPAIVIAKDQTFFERFGRDPDRGDFAKLLNLLPNAGVKVAALDFIFDQPTLPEKDEELAKALASVPYTILAQHHITRGRQTFEKVNLSDQRGNRPPWPLPLYSDLDQAATLKGSINIVSDFDSTIRYVPIAFHPAEKVEFHPTLGFSAYIAWLFSRQQDQIDSLIHQTSGSSTELLLETLLQKAPLHFNSTGHPGIDAMIKQLEIDLLSNRIKRINGTENLTDNSISSFYLKQRKTTWLELPKRHLPLIGDYHQPCLRLNFNKAPPPLNSDGIEQFSLGTLIKTESDLQNANRLFVPDLIVKNQAPKIVNVDFNWSNNGNGQISGQILSLASSTLPATEIRLEMNDSAFWQSSQPPANGKFVINHVPTGNFTLTAIFRYEHGWVKASHSGQIKENEKLILPNLFHISPEKEIEINNFGMKNDDAMLCFFGDCLELVKTDNKGRLPFSNLPDNLLLSPIDDEIEIASQSGNIILDHDGKPVSEQVIAILPEEDHWNHRFFFRYPATAHIFLPTSLDCRFTVFAKNASSSQQTNVDMVVLPDTDEIDITPPPACHFDDQGKTTFFKSDPEIKEIILISETEEILTLPTNRQTSIKPGNYRIFSELNNLKGRFNNLKASFKNRTTFIGTTLQEDQDLISTPINFFDADFSVLPGVHLHANLFSALVREDFLITPFFHQDRSPGFWHIFQALLVLPFLLISNQIFFKKGAAWGATSILVLSFSWLGFSFIAFLHGYLLPLLYPVLQIFSFGIMRGYFAWEIARRKENETRSTFGRFISAAVVDEILKTPDSLKPGGEKKELTIMFTDLAGFTTISEKLAPEQLTELMNEYLGEMTRLLFKYQGTLDKYIGDAIMAFWNHPRPQPDHPVLAAQCAIAMQQKLNELREKWLQQGLPEVQVRAGINTSTCMVGFIGSDVQMNFTCLGDGVNLASRLEGANKNYGTLNMIAESVYTRLDHKVFSTRFLDYLAVKGKDQPIKVYELRGLCQNETKAWQTASPIYHQGIEFYLQRKWQDAINNFNQVLELVPEDKPAAIFIERCRQFAGEPPPEKWDGRYILKTK